MSTKRHVYICVVNLRVCGQLLQQLEEMHGPAPYFKMYLLFDAWAAAHQQIRRKSLAY